MICEYIEITFEEEDFSQKEIVLPNFFKPEYSEVSGLSFFKILYSKVYNKFVILLGEYHNKEKLCNPVKTVASDFLIDMLNSTDKSTDLFLENKFFPIEEKTKRMNQVKFGNYFRGFLGDFLDNSGCIIDKNSNCKIKSRDNLRIHNIDIRFPNFTEIDGKFKIKNKYLILGYLSNVFETTRIYSEDIKHERTLSFLEKYQKYENKETIKKEILDLIDLLKIKKQIESVFYPEVKKFLNSLIIQFKTDLEIFSDVLKPSSVKRILESSSVNDKNILLDMSQFKTLLRLMDIYGFARVFKKFNYKDGKFSDECKNIIMYTGASHSENYEKYFKMLNFKTLYNGIQSKSTSCMNIKDLEINWI